MAILEFKLKFWADQSLIATILQLVLLVLLVVSLIFTLAANGVFSHEYNQDQVNDEYYCFIYMKSGALQILLPGDNGYCQFVIIGHSLVALFLLGLLIILFITMFVRPRFMCMLGFLVIVGLACMLALVSSIVLSAGFIETCKAVEKSFLNPKCSDYSSVYDVLERSTACSWMATITLITISVLSCVYTSVTKNCTPSKLRYTDLT